MRKAKNAIFGGALALQAVPMLKASGRTTSALSGTAAGFAGIGAAGAVADVAFGMVESPRAFATKTKLKRRKR